MIRNRGGLWGAPDRRTLIRVRLAWRAGPIGGRLTLLLGAFYLGLLILGGSLFRIQVIQGPEYHLSLDRQSLRRVRLPAIRGKILDRRSRTLVDNRPSYDLVLYPEEVYRSDLTGDMSERTRLILSEMAPRLGHPSAVTGDTVRSHLEQARPLPLTLWEDLSLEQISGLLEPGLGLPGVELVARPVRNYPSGALAGHLLGYLGRTRYLDSEQLDEYHFFLPDSVGKSGIEKAFDAQLRGWAGAEMLRVDVIGYRHEVLSRRSRPALPGDDLILALDRDLQRVLEEAMRGRWGAVVALDPQNGDILAMVSSPGLDPRDFSPRLTQERLDLLLSHPGRPFQNRAMYAVYPPGSTFKPIVALAALEKGVIGPDFSVVCRGSMNVGTSRFRCLSVAGHGRVDLAEALEVSCNIFFYEVALRLGLEPIREMSSRFHLGRKFGLSIGGESAGLVPSDSWKLQRFGDHWRAGDTANLSIGQGAISVTVLQMATVAAALANGGTLWKPRPEIGIRDHRSGRKGSLTASALSRNLVDARHIEAVRRGMREVVQGPRGSGRRAGVLGYPAGGKTGTATYVAPGGEKRDHAWFIGFAPWDRPRIAIAVVVENSSSGGGRDAAPVAARGFAHWLETEPVYPWEGFEPTGEGRDEE